MAAGRVFEIAFNLAAKMNSGFSGAFTAASAQLTGMQANVKALNEQMSDLDKSFASGGMSQAQYDQEKVALLQKTEATQKAAAAQLQMNAAMQKVSSSFSALTKSAAVYVGTLGAIATLGGGGFLAVGEKVAKDAALIGKTAATLKMTTDGYQELKYGMNIAGLATEDFDSVLGTMKVNLNRSAEGFGRAKKVLDLYGISAENLSNMGTEQAFEWMIDVLGRVQDPAQQATLAMAVFGEQGLQIARIAQQQGVGGLQALKAEARDMGLVMSTETIKSSQSMMKAQRRMGLAINGMRLQLGSALIPAFSAGFQQIEQIVRSPEIKAQIAELATSLATGAATAVPYIVQFAMGVKEFIGVAGQMISTAAQAVGGYQNLGMIVAGLFGAKVIADAFIFIAAVGEAAKAIKAFGIASTLASMQGGILSTVMRGASIAFDVARIGASVVMMGAYAVWTGITAAATTAWTGAQWLLNAALTANPIGLVIAGIAALIAIGYVCYQNWDTIKAFFVTLWDDPLAAIGQFTAGIQSYFAPVLDWLENKWNAIKSAFSNIPISFGGGGNGADIAANASGGIYGQGAFLTTFAEDSPEAAIPLDGSPRAMGLLAQTADMMGVPLGGGGLSAVFSPSITINGGGDSDRMAATLQQVLEEERGKFARMLQDYESQQRRVSYA